MISQLLCAAALVVAVDSQSQPKPETQAKAQPQRLATDAPDLMAIERNIVAKTNQERARRGLPALKVDMKLVESARKHCSWMVRSRRFQHTNANVGENIAMGQPNSTSAVQAWMNSSGHRKNILNPNYKRIGVSAYRTSSGTIYWCQQFLY